MSVLSIVSLAIAAFVLTTIPAAGKDFVGTVISILDGDTIEVLHNARPERIRLNVSGRLQTLEDLRQFPIRAGSQNLTLGEIATIKRGYAEPPAQRIHFNGQSALLIGVSMQQGGDVIALGKAMQQTITSVQKQLPVGVNLQLVTSQPDIVQHSVHDFVRSLTEALIIVLAVSLL